MIPFRWLLLTVVTVLISTPVLHAQQSKVAVVDFERAVVESTEGKKASDRFNATVKEKQADVEKRQKELDEQEKKLQNGARTLSDAAKADLQKDIQRRQTELQRINEDAQKELQTLRDELLRPIAEIASAIVNAMAKAQGYTLIVDVSNPQNNVLWFNPKNDITADLIKAIDAQLAKEPAKTEAPKAPTPGPTAIRPTTPSPRPGTTPVPPPAPRKP